MFNWIVNGTYQYLEPFNFVELCKTELFEIELFDYFTVLVNDWSLIKLLVLNSNTWNHLTVCKQMINSK